VGSQIRYEHVLVFFFVKRFKEILVLKLDIFASTYTHDPNTFVVFRALVHRARKYTSAPASGSSLYIIFSLVHLKILLCNIAGHTSSVIPRSKLQFILFFYTYVLLYIYIYIISRCIAKLMNL
jgi:hypothetical protein